MAAEQYTDTKSQGTAGTPSSSSTEKLAQLDNQRPSEESARIQDINHQINALDQTLHTVKESLAANRTAIEQAIESGEKQGSELDAKLVKSLELIKGLEGSYDSLQRKSALMGIEVQKLEAGTQQALSESEQSQQSQINNTSKSSIARDNAMAQRTDQLSRRTTLLAASLQQQAEAQDLAVENTHKAIEESAQVLKQQIDARARDCPHTNVHHIADLQDGLRREADDP